MRRRTLLLSSAASLVPSWAGAQCVTDTVAVDACRGGVYVGGAGAPSLDLNFTGGTLDPRITFTRGAGPATYFDVAGVLQTAGTNVARFDYDPVTHAPRGLLIEEARTNLALQSGDFTSASWSKINFTLAAGTPGPNGATTGSGLIPNNGALGSLQQSITSTIATYTLSCFAKAGTQSSVLLLMPAAWWIDATNRTATFNLAAGTLGALGGGGTSSTITSVGNGWYRISLTATPDVAAAGVTQCARQAVNGDGVSVYTYAFGAQVEAGAFATSYIPTTTASATRAAEAASMPVAAWFDPTQISVVTDAMVLASVAGGSGLVSVNDGAAANRLQHLVFSLSPRSTVTSATVSSVTNPETATIPAVTPFRFGGSLIAGKYMSSLNGASPYQNTTGIVMPVSIIKLTLGNSASGVAILNGWISRVRCWPRALSAAELQAVTT